MRLRTKLVLAFLLLSAVPLSGVVLYSYASSIRSLREAAHRSNAELAAEMSQRMDRVKEGVSKRVQGLRDLPLGELMTGAASEAEWEGMLKRVDAGLGDVAPFVEALEFVPEVGPAAGEGAPAAASGDPRFVIWLNRGGERARRGSAAAESLGLGLDVAALEKVLTETARLGAMAAATAARRAAETAGRRPFGLPAPPVSPPPPPAPPAAVARWHGMAAAEMEALKAGERESKRLLGRDFECQVERHGRKVGEIKARVSAKQLLKGILSLTRRERGEIPFAIDADGTIHAASSSDLEALKALPLSAGTGTEGQKASRDWAVVKVEDEESGLVYGIARPLGASLAELKATAGRNFAYGMGVVAVALVGVAPLSRRITRDLSALTVGAQELAGGKLEVEVPVRSRDEVGRLAATFNRMAADLAHHQRRLVEEERLRKEHELERRLLAAENARKTRELEDAREFQLSLLPKRLPEHPELEIAVYMTTATEVGGDYYDFHLAPDGTLTVAIGDATGHGARAGTMVTVIKSLFAARAAAWELPAFLRDANRAIRVMDLGRMAMALALLRVTGSRLAFASAGMPGALLFRAATGAVEEIAVEGVPLGSLTDCPYRQLEADLWPGDTVLLMSDGFPELTSQEGEVQGYDRAEAAFAAAAEKPAAAVIADLSRAASAWKAGAPPDDDVTFVVLKRRRA